jgi:hypothetical protein
MILISHRGNIDGAFPKMENQPFYVNKALKLGYDVEIDVWLINNKFYLGHDEPQYNISINWLNNISHKLWIHCKNINVIEFFNRYGYNLNYFWHENDVMTLTSKKYLWVYPGNQPIKNSIAVMPELFDDDTSQCLGICSDYIKKYLEK